MAFIQHLPTFIRTIPGVTPDNFNAILYAIGKLHQTYIKYIFVDATIEDIKNNRFIYIFERYLTSSGYKNPAIPIYIDFTSENHVKTDFMVVKKLIPYINETDLADYILERRLWQPYVT